MSDPYGVGADDGLNSPSWSLGTALNFDIGSAVDNSVSTAPKSSSTASTGIDLSKYALPVGAALLLLLAAGALASSRKKGSK